MPPITERKFMLKERDRLARFQHQHRGLNFLKVWLPPNTDRNVKIIGLNNHVFKGQIPSVPIDELPPDVDPKSIDEEELYEEIKNMKFPEVPPQEPLGPSRRIGGEYTKVKQLFFAPVSVQHKFEDKEKIPVLGADSHVYRGSVKPAVVTELSRKVRGTKRLVRSRAAKGSNRETIEPSVVSLYVDGRTLPENGQPPAPLIQMPISQLNRMLEVVNRQEKRKIKKSSIGSKSKESEEDSSLEESVDNSGSMNSDELTGSRGTEEESGSKNSVFEGDSCSNGGSAPKDSEKSSDAKNSEFEEASYSKEVFDTDSEEGSYAKDPEGGSEETSRSKDSQPIAKVTELAEVDVTYNEPTFTYHTDENNNSQMGENPSIPRSDKDSGSVNKESPREDENHGQGSD